MLAANNIFQLKEVSAKVNAAAGAQEPIDWESCSCNCRWFSD